MKNFFKATLIFLLFFTFASSAIVQAEQVGPAVVQESNRVEATNAQEGQDRREVIKNQTQEKIATRASRLNEARKNIIRNRFRKMMRRLSAALVRLERITNRIESRIEKLEEKNKNMELDNAKTKIETVKQKIDETGYNLIPQAGEKFEEVVEGENPKEIFSEVRELIKETKQEIIEIHQLLVDIIRSIKASVKTEE